MVNNITILGSVIDSRSRGMIKGQFTMNRHQQGRKQRTRQRTTLRGRSRRRHFVRPAVAHRQRGVERSRQSEAFNAPEVWHEPSDRDEIKYIVQSPGSGYIHPVTVKAVRARIAQLPEWVTCELDVVQFSRMSRKRELFPCYGMQWGSSVYLYPIEESLVESYVRPPRPEQIVEARMYGGRWSQQGNMWQLKWTIGALRDFYLNNVLIHEIGHIVDNRNTNFEARERYANWFAVEYGFRVSRGRR